MVLQVLLALLDHQVLMDNQVLKESLESLVKRVMLDLLAHKVFQDLTVLLDLMVCLD